jgi:lipopolysaccharide transport system ATP-binding protein
MKPIIRVENLGKQYTIGAKAEPYTTLRESLVRTARKPIDMFRGNAKRRDEQFWALKDVSFDVIPGEVVGIIGRNGAGKSTLLKILSRITEPTTGRVELYGRVGSLLEVGTGFHPELTGRENIFLNGAILGMRREEIAKKFDEIVDFAEIEEFLDTPVKRYSSGMYVRLAFAVAAHLDPEILVVDEVLAVGDSQFQKKCLGKMDEVSKAGRTVLFVSHQLGMLSQLCRTCILLEKGKILLQDKTESVIEAYLNSESGDETAYYCNENEVSDKAAYFVYQKVVDDNGNAVGEITNNDPLVLETKIRVESFHRDMELSLSLQHKLKGRIFTVNTPLRDFMTNGKSEKTIRLEIPANFIAPNHYSWISAIHIPGKHLEDVLWDECRFSITDTGSEFARYEGGDYGCIILNQYKIHAFDA